MRIPSGVTDQYIYFVAVDATDLKTRETGLSGFTVYRSRNGGAAAAMTTPTINETDATNMPGVYELLLDEDMTIDSGDDSQEMVFHITVSGMAPVTRTIELYRPKLTAGNTLGVASDGDISGNVDGAVASVTAAVTAGTVSDKTGYSLSAAGVDAIWDEVITGHVTADSFGKVFDDQIDGLRAYGDANWLTATGFSTHSAADVWAVGTRALTDKAGFSLSAAGIDAIWDELTTGHVTASSFAVLLTDVLADVTGINGDAMRGTDSALLASSAPANFGDLAITASTGLVSVGTNNDKTGYSISGTKTTLDALNDITTAQVNAEVVDALATDTYAEPGQGAPAATTTLAAKINYLYKSWRNKKDQDSSTWQLYDDAGTTVDQKATVADTGSLASKAEIVSGP